MFSGVPLLEIFVMLILYSKLASLVKKTDLSKKIKKFNKSKLIIFIL